MPCRPGRRPSALTNNVNTQSAWLPFLAVYNVSSINSTVYSALSGGQSLSTVITAACTRLALWTSEFPPLAWSGPPMACLINWAASLHVMQHVRARLLCLHAGATNAHANVDGSSADLTTSATTWPVQAPQFVRSAAVTLLPSTKTVLVSGGMQESGADATQVSTPLVGRCPHCPAWSMGDCMS